MSTDAQPDRLLKVVGIAMALGLRHLTPYGSVKSRKDFTQPQLMTCLILRSYLKTAYRGVIEFLAVASELREAIGLEKLPHYSTLKKFAAREGAREAMDRMLATLASSAAQPGAYVGAAMDATGLESSAASAHFVSRSGRRRKKFVKVSVLVLCGSLIPASMVVDGGRATTRSRRVS